MSTAEPVSEHVEKVAWAICIVSGLDPDFDYDPLDLSGTKDKRWRLFIPQATAALAVEQDKKHVDLSIDDGCVIMRWKEDGKDWSLTAICPHVIMYDGENPAYHVSTITGERIAAPVAAPVQEPVATVVWYDPRTDMLLYERPHKIIDASVDFVEAAPIGTKLYAAPVQIKDVEKLATGIVQSVCEMTDISAPDGDDTLLVTTDDLQAIIVKHLTDCGSTPSHDDVVREAMEHAAKRIDEEWRKNGGLNCTHVCAILRAISKAHAREPNYADWPIDTCDECKKSGKCQYSEAVAMPEYRCVDHCQYAVLSSGDTSNG